jgi:membrane associated rhomboid family serine protease
VAEAWKAVVAVTACRRVIPLRDTITSRTVPVVTYAIMAANIAVYLYQESLGSAFEGFSEVHGLVPKRFVAEWWSDVTPLFTSMFLHGGWLHLLGNLLYLHIFGDNVEDRLGHARFLLFYLLAGATAGLAQVMMHPATAVPMVGASGAIAGVTGAYFLFYPRARVVTLVPIFLFVQVVEIPAFFFLLFWFAFQLLLGLGSIGTETGGGIAFWAHLGGFAAGMILGPALVPRTPVRPAW